MEVDSKPEEIDELDRRIIQLKIEQSAPEKEDDPASKDRLQKLKKELNELEGRSQELTLVWQAEKEQISGVQKLKEQLDQARSELEIAQRNGDLNRAGELMYGVIPELERKLQKDEAAESHHMLNEEVTEADIASVIAKWTGIPLEKMLEGEKEKMLHMEENLHSVSYTHLTLPTIYSV